jgi:GNAT superfamily N-acetyltransferase
MYTIKQAGVEDVETIRQIADATWWQTYAAIIEREQIEYMLQTMYSSEVLQNQIASGSQTFLLLLEEGIPVAFAAYSPRNTNPDIYKLHKLYCLPSTQGKGYGKILINEVAAKTKEAGKNILQLNVNKYNNAKSFYEKMGFAIAYEEDIPIGKYWMNDYVMQKDL